MSQETATFRIPPQAIEVEKHVIGALLLDEEAIGIAAGILGTQDFYSEKHAILFDAITWLLSKRITPDLLTVSEELRRRRRFEDIGGDSYLLEISSEVVSSANVAAHCQIVKDKSLLRAVIKAATRSLEAAYRDQENPSQLIQNVQTEAFRLGDLTRGRAEGLVSMHDGLSIYAKELEKREAGENDRTYLGIGPIDDVLMGLQKGGVYLLAARPGLGKSALALQASISCGKPVPNFSMEMRRSENYERMMAQIDPALNSNGLSTPAQITAKRAQIAKAFAELAKYQTHISQSTRVTTDSIYSQSMKMKREFGDLGFILVDYLQLVKAKRPGNRRDLEVGEISGDLKEIGDILDVPILAVASLSRESEKRDDKRPIESDLRDAGQLESDAHGIVFIYRHSKYSPSTAKDPKVKNVTEILIRKNRGGGTGRVLLEFNGARSKFYALTPEDQRYYWNHLEGKSFLGEEDKNGKPRLPKAGKKHGKKGDSWHNGDGMGAIPAAEKDDSGDPEIV